MILSLNLEIDSWAHKISAGYKMFFLAIISLFSIYVPGIPYLILALFCVCLLYISLGKRAYEQGLYMVKPLLWIIVIMLVYHVLTRNLNEGLRIILKMVSLVGLANFVTMTSRLDDMMEVFLKLLAPLRYFGVNIDVIAMTFTLVIRFTPVLLQKALDLSEAWRARSSKHVGWRIILPLFLVSIDDAETVAEALRARGGITRK